MCKEPPSYHPFTAAAVQERHGRTIPLDRPPLPETEIKPTQRASGAREGEQGPPLLVRECGSATGEVTKRRTETVSDKSAPLREVGPHAGWWRVPPRPFGFWLPPPPRIPSAPPSSHACLTSLAKGFPFSLKSQTKCTRRRIMTSSKYGR